MGDTKSAILWAILLLVTNASLQVIGTVGHHHSLAEHFEQRNKEWQNHNELRQSIDRRTLIVHQNAHPLHQSVEGVEKPQTNDPKSSKIWHLDSNPNYVNQFHEFPGWQFRQWQNRLAPSITTTSTTTTTTPRTTLTRQTPFPSLWSYVPKKSLSPTHNHRRNNSTPMTRDLISRHG